MFSFSIIPECWRSSSVILNADPVASALHCTSFTRPHAVDDAMLDIIDESIDLFRANSLFRNFEIKGAADRVSQQERKTKS